MNGPSTRMPNLPIRPFAPDDAPAVLAIEQAVWGESRLSAVEVAALAARPEHGVWVAEARGTVVGFAWCFLTHTHGHGPAWELDLLAVHPDHRGQGLGAALIAAAYRGGRARGAPQCRAIVAEANHPSQRAFANAGFARAADLRDLMVSKVQRVAQPIRLPPPYEPGDYDSYVFRLAEPPARLTAGLMASFTDFDADGAPLIRLEALPVYTLLYSGLWLEAMLYRADETLVALLQRVRDFARARALPEVTHLAWPQMSATHATLLREGFKVENRYYVFTREYLET